MRVLNSFSSALLAFSLSTALAAPAEGAPACIIPFIIFESISGPFQLAAVANSIKTSTAANPFPVRTIPRSPTNKDFSEPILSRAKIAPTLFKLKNGKLIVEGFKATVLPFIEIFPPVLQTFGWGGEDFSSPLNFTASFTCDNTGKQFLRLATDEGTFAVKSYSEGKQVFIKPDGFEGKVVDVQLEIIQKSDST